MTAVALVSSIPAYQSHQLPLLALLTRASTPWAAKHPTRGQHQAAMLLHLHHTALLAKHMVHTAALAPDTPLLLVHLLPSPLLMTQSPQLQPSAGTTLLLQMVQGPEVLHQRPPSQLGPGTTLPLQTGQRPIKVYQAQALCALAP